MDTNQTQNEHLDRLIAAFETDHFSVDRDEDVFYTPARKRMGLRAHHQTAYIDGDKERGKKKAFYVEGSHYEMGYLLGRMAEPEIEQMCTKFNERIEAHVKI